MMSKKVMLLGVCILVGIGILAGIVIVQKKSRGGVILRFHPPKQSVVTGKQAVTAQILLDARGIPVSAATIVFQYDPTHIRITNIAPGEAFPVDLCASSSYCKTTFRDGQGRIDVAVSPSGKPVTQTGVAAIITYDILEEIGQTRFSLADETAVAAIGYQQNVLSHTEPGILLIEKAQ